MSDLKPQNPISNRLPALEPKVDINSLHSAYSLGTTVGSGSSTGYGTTALGGVIGTSSFSGQSTAFTDRRIQDFIVLFEREVRENITTGGYDPRGKAVARIINGGTEAGGIGWFLLSCVTLTIPNWFGMPFYNYRTELELEVEIRDCNDRVIGRYQGQGVNRTQVAAWHGYAGGEGSITQVTGREEAARMSNINAVKMAMANIKAKIQQDADRLTRELNACR